MIKFFKVKKYIKTKFILFNTLFRFGYSMSCKSIWQIQEEEKWVKPNFCAPGIYNLGGKVRTLKYIIMVIAMDAMIKRTKQYHHSIEREIISTWIIMK